jgi:hypothetical protein
MTTYSKKLALAFCDWAIDMSLKVANYFGALADKLDPRPFVEIEDFDYAKGCADIERMIALSEEHRRDQKRTQAVPSQQP